MNEAHYQQLITDDILAGESGIRWLREPKPYLYLRECLWMESDHGREVRPLLELPEGREIIGVAETKYRYSGPRRVWYLWHSEGLDGIDLYPVIDPEGLIVKPTVAAGVMSEPGFIEREVTADDFATATVAKLAALDFWAAHDREQARLLEIHRAQHQRKLDAVRAAMRNPYKAEDEAIEAEDARILADYHARIAAERKAAMRDHYKA